MKKEDKKKRAPSRTPEQQENRMISLAMKQAEEALEKGTASSQIVVHFLKLATTKQQYEIEKLKADTDLAKAKISNLEAQEKSEERYLKAIEAMKRYQGSIFMSEEEEDD